MNKIQETIIKNKLITLYKEGKYQEASPYCQQLIAVNQKDMHLWYTFGQIQEKLNNPDPAVKAFLNATKIKSEITHQALEKAIDISTKHNLIALGFMAATSLVKADPESEYANFKAGSFALDLQLNYLSAQHFKKTIELQETENKSYRTLYAQALNCLGRTTEALAQYAKAIQIDPSDDYAYFRAAFAHNYSEDIDEDVVFSAHKSYGELLKSKFPKIEPFKPKQKPKRIKVAYLSKDFGSHPIAYFILPIIQNSNKDLFETFIYSDESVSKEDKMTDKIKQYCERWTCCKEMTDDELYFKVRHDEIDILVDLQGLTGFPRMSIFARRAAPIQVTYLGYPNTTGLENMDYRIVDHWTDPVGMTEKFNSETLVRLPSGFICYSPELPKLDVSELPALNIGKLTFGSFNFYGKVTPSILKTWTTILNSVENSQLLIKAKCFNEAHNVEQIQELFASEGISKNRLILLSWTRDEKAHLSLYNQVDIHLDTTPYNGTTTTCEALWLGVPTITLAGVNHRSRVGCSILEQVGLQDFIATSKEEYINIAIEKAKDLQALSSLRVNMRERLKDSKLLDTGLFVKEIEEAYLDMYKKL